MKLGLSLQTSLLQTLTPQQIQYLKLLQLPAMQMEQHVRAEMENNPMLEEAIDDADMAYEAEQSRGQESTDFTAPQRDDAPSTSSFETPSQETPVSDLASEFDPKDAFEFYKLIWGEDPSSGRAADAPYDDDDDETESMVFKDTPSFTDDLFEQLRFLPMSHEERFLAQQIVGNVDTDGYLRRDLNEIIEETNTMIAEHNIALSAPAMLGTTMHATMTAALINDIDEPLEQVHRKQAEVVLKKIQSLDPPGVASRTVQECLLAQLRALPKLNAAQKLAVAVLTDTYDAFAMKHYHVIERTLGVTSDYLREAIEVIRSLNPRPGGGTFGQEMNTVAPDFIVERDEELDDFIVTVNDSRLPALRVSTAYERLKKEARYRKFNKETREWLRKKYEDAKFLIQAIRQRKSTMLRVMTAIVALQEDFFRHGPAALKPLIYRDVSEVAGMDISTICRIVNGKYVVTEFGTFELKYFFSESLLTDEGEEISTRIIKQKIKDMIDAESKVKPLSDDKLAKDLKKLGYNVARRTVAKYREQLRIPVARLRREL
ncbi:MAG: RNA polymerase factor sigma-54 [Bacteroidetes bacterium]|nr:RNA polymerase factor sigma-54 [Bacteroidota bacterium]